MSIIEVRNTFINLLALYGQTHPIYPLLLGFFVFFYFISLVNSAFISLRSAALYQFFISARVKRQSGLLENLLYHLEFCLSVKHKIHNQSTYYQAQYFLALENIQANIENFNVTHLYSREFVCKLSANKLLILVDLLKLLKLF